MGALAEFERALIRERQREGIALEKRRGVYRSRKKLLSPKEAERLRERVACWARNTFTGCTGSSPTAAAVGRSKRPEVIVRSKYSANEWQRSASSKKLSVRPPGKSHFRTAPPPSPVKAPTEKLRVIRVGGTRGTGIM